MGQPRANVYRRLNSIPYEWGTAVNVQVMVFGNMGLDSGTGVAFSHVSNGEMNYTENIYSTLKVKTLLLVLEHPEPIANEKSKSCYL